MNAFEHWKGGEEMKVCDYHYRFLNGSALSGAKDAYVLACLAVRSLLGIDQTSLDTQVIKGRGRLPKSIRCRDRVGRALSAIFNGFLAESLDQDSYLITTTRQQRR